MFRKIVLMKILLTIKKTERVMKINLKMEMNILNRNSIMKAIDQLEIQTNSKFKVGFSFIKVKIQVL